MASSIGRRNLFAMGREEAAVGTLSTQLVSFPFDSLSDTYTKNVVENTQAYGRVEAQKQGSEIGSKMGEVTFGGFLPTENIGQLLYGLFGTLSTANDTPVVGTYTHTFSVANTNEPESYSLVWQDATGKQQMLASRVSSCTITATTEDWARYEITFMGKFPTTSSATIPAFAEKPNFTVCQATLKIGDTLSGLGSALGMSNTELTFERNAEAHYAYGSCDVERIICGPWQVSASLEILWEDRTIHDYFVNHDQKAIELKFTTEDFITGTTPYTTTFNMNAGTFRTAEIGRDLDGKQMLTTEYTGEYNVTDSAMAGAIVVNGLAGTAY